MTKAVIFLPPNVPLDGRFAEQSLDHVTRHGYDLLATTSDWSEAWGLLRNGQAQVIVVARRAHLDPAREPRVEFVGPETRRIVRARPANERSFNAGPVRRARRLP